jgi:hypothetical protein
MDIFNTFRLVLSFSLSAIVIIRLLAGKVRNDAETALTVSVLALAFAVSPV